MALVASGRVVNECPSPRVALRQAAFHMRMALSCLGLAICQMFAVVFHKLAVLLDPIVYFVYRQVDRVHVFFADRLPRLGYHRQMLWDHRKALLKRCLLMFLPVFGLQFVTVLAVLAAVQP